MKDLTLDSLDSRPWTSLSMHISLLVVSLLSAGLSLSACADKLPSRSMRADDFDAAATKARLLGLERQQFDASHPLKGQVAEKALAQLQDEGYLCHIEHLDLPRVTKNGVTFELVRTPLVLCVQHQSKPNDICVERHVNLSIRWQDSKAPERELRSQLASSVITDRAFRCDEASESVH